MNFLPTLLRLVMMLIVIVAPIKNEADTSKTRLENSLVQAARQGDIKEILRLVKEGVDLKQTAALTAAVEAGRLDIVRYLVEHGADPDGKKKGSAISAAAKNGNAEILSYLLKQGADINAESPTDTSIISTPLIEAVYYGRLEAARLLIRFGADVNRLSRKGNTALHQAIRYTNGNQPELVRLLLKNGTDPDMKDGHGVTARQLAKSLPSDEIAVLIQQAQPAVVKKAPEPRYGYSLDSITAGIIERLFKFQHESIQEVSVSSGIFHYDGTRPAFADCKYKKEYRRSVPELRLLIAICGAGPFDEVNLDETLSIVRALLNQGGVASDKPELREQLIRDYRVSKTMRSVSYLTPLFGHGIEFVPTSVIQDLESHTNLVVQIAVGDEDLYDLSRMQDAGLKLHDYLVGNP